MNDKPIEIVYSYKLNTENIKEGMYLLDNTKNPKIWYIDKELVEQMMEYKNTEDKLAIRNNKITGKFLYFKYNKNKK